MLARILTPATLAVALLLGAPPVAAREIRAADMQPEGFPSVVSLQNLGRKLAAATQGRLTLRMFPGAVLGDERDMIGQTQAGGIDLLRVSLGSVGTVVPEVNVFNLPFVFRDEAHMRKVIDGPIGTELLARISNSPAGLVALGWMDAGTRNLYTRLPVRQPADLAGQKIRMIGNPVLLDTMNAMGASGVPMGFGELHGGLQSGAVDGAENNVPTYVTQGHFTQARYYNLTGHLIVPEIFVYSKARWNALSAEEQALLRKLSREAQLEQRQLWDKRVAIDTARMKAAGVHIVSDVDRRAFYKATQRVRDRYGAGSAELLRRIEATR
ncbi:MAG: TRAP transporter substrate-binding protein [Candidatus Dactylopiibacterium sp.]|nr:TRAP transporter substrate-binding protein [Candidatus Dactylopiibacterium sp.]